jgi:predicted neuraminidase
MNSEHIFGDSRPFPSCHASSLAKVGGDYMAVWFGGTHEKHNDVAIWTARREAKGAWSSPRRLAKVSDEAHWNPVVFAAPNGPLHVWFKVGRTIGGWRTYTMISNDGGAAWSEPRELVPGDTSGGRGPVKNKPIVLASGAWLAGASHEAEGWKGFVDRSEDSGRTWRQSEYLKTDPAVITGPGIIQPTLWESRLGNVHLLLRSTCGAICRADSADDGRTWSPVYKTDIPNNNSGIDLARLADGTLVLCCTPVAEKVRTPLSLLVSTDNGKTWPRRLDLETAPGEYSYPAVIADGPDAVAVTYTWKRERIAFRRVSLAEIPPRKG